MLPFSSFEAPEHESHIQNVMRCGWYEIERTYIFSSMALNVCTEYEKPESFVIRDTSLAVYAPRMAVRIAPLRSICDLLYNKGSSR